MERGQVRYAEDQFAAHRQHAADLVEDPEQLLDVLQHLVGHDDVDGAVGKGQRVALYVQAMDADPLLGQAGGILRVDLDGMDRCSRRRLLREQQIVSLAGAQIKDRAERRCKRQEIADMMTAVVQGPVDHSATRQLSVCIFSMSPSILFTAKIPFRSGPE